MSADVEESFDDFAVFAIPRLRQIAFAWCRDWHHADDVVQGALERVFAAWPRVRKGDAFGYTRTTLVRLLISEQRRPWRRHEVVASGPAEPEPVAHAGEGGLRTDMVAALATLPAGQRAVVLLRCLEDLSVAQTAEALGCSEGTVKSQAHQGRTALKAWFSDPPLPPPRSARTEDGPARQVTSAGTRHDEQHPPIAPEGAVR